MRGLRITVAIVGAVAATAGVGRAQDGAPRSPLPARAAPVVEQAITGPPLLTLDSDGRRQELEAWIEDFSAWKKWTDRWGNRREPGWFSNFRKRRTRPDPPWWLSDCCAELLDESGAMAEACTLLAEWRADLPTGRVTVPRVAATSRAERDNKTIWWEHVHLDLAWPAMQSGVTHFGVIGMHATTSVRGRLEIFIAPGAMLVNVATRRGARAWQLATNYGIGYRVGRFKFPGNHTAVLHLNLAKAWLLSGGADVATRSTDFVGFSITFNKAR